jgi:anti-anti-sigma factor
MSLTVQTEQRADVVVVSVAGELDMATAPQLQDQISDLLERGRTRLVFDLAEVSF